MARPVNPFHEDTLPPFDGFPKDTLRFLRELKKNNTREWFNANKDRYEQAVKEPMLMLLASLEARLRVAFPDVVLEPKKAMYRIYRDVRFSADKSPYKEWVAAAFTYRGFDRKNDAAFYFHFSPEEFGIGGGLYAPMGDRLKNLRKAIDTDASELHAILKDKTFRKYFGELQGEELARVPQGYDKEHPEAALLRKKQFLCWTTQPTATLADAAVVDLLMKHFSAMAPFVRWLADHS